MDIEGERKGTGDKKGKECMMEKKVKEKKIKEKM